MPPRDARQPRPKSIYAPTPSVRAVTDEQAKPSFEDLVRELKAAKEAEARSVWQASGLERIARESAQAAPSAEVTGWGLLGPNLYRKLGGDVQHPAIPEEGSAAWTALEAAGLLPFGRPLRAIPAGVKGAKALLAGKTAAEAGVAAKETYRASGPIVRAAKGARAGLRAPAPRPEGAEKIIEALPEARRVRAEQEKLRKAQRKERVGNARAARKAAGGGEAGLRASRAEMRGEYARLPLDRLVKEYGPADSELRKAFQPQVDALLDDIAAHPSQEGLEFRIGNTQDALLKMLDGDSITKSEIRALENVFGDEATQMFKWRAAREKAIKLSNVPRALQSSYDLTVTLRQLLVSGVRHPTLLKDSFSAQIQAVRSQAAARAFLDEIRARPRYDQMLDDGLKLTELRGRPGRIEEDFIGAEYAEKIPLVGHGVRASTRAFTVGGAKFRADLYDLIMDQAEAAGKTLTKKERRDFTSVINAGTGRGNMGADILEKAAPLGTVLLWSPRLIASRLAFINPLWYVKLSGPARREALESFVSVVVFGMSVLWLAEQLGAEVEGDPRSSDFGKIRVGDTRVDIWGGFQQYVVNGYRYIKGETKGPDGEIRSKTREEIAWNFGSGKAAPIPGLIRDAQRGRTFDYQPLDTKEAYASAVGKLFVPLNVNNAWDAREDPAVAGLTLGLGGVGLGVQTYPPNTKKGGRSKSIYNSGGGSSRPKSIYNKGSK